MIDGQAVEANTRFEFAFITPQREIEFFPTNLLVVELLCTARFLLSGVERSHIGVAAQTAHDFQSQLSDALDKVLARVSPIYSQKAGALWPMVLRFSQMLQVRALWFWLRLSFG